MKKTILKIIVTFGLTILLMGLGNVNAQIQYSEPAGPPKPDNVTSTQNTTQTFQTADAPAADSTGGGGTSLPAAQTSDNNSSSDPATAGSTAGGTGGTSGDGEFFGPTLNTYLENVYIWSIGIAGLLAIIMLMYAGYQYATSQGNPEQINQAKEIIVGSLAGLVLLIIAALVVQAMGLGV